MAARSRFIITPANAMAQPRGVPVHATLRRPIFASIAEVTAPDYRTPPLHRNGASRCTVYVEGVPGDTFAIEMCYFPVFGAKDVFDATASKWVTIGTAKILPAPYKPVVKQTFEDLGYHVRITRTGGAGAFQVYLWGFD
jgi:hypothetical protein